MKRCSARIMTSPAVVVTVDTCVPTASALMKERGIRHLPVVENGRLVGIVSRSDLREASISASANADTYEFNFLLSKLAVGRLMTRKVFTITPDALIVQAAELMTERKIAALPVVDPDGSVAGIVTESDLLRSWCARQKPEGRLIQERHGTDRAASTERRGPLPPDLYKLVAGQLRCST
jgi:CBS domain-containing protein